MSAHPGRLLDDVFESLLLRGLRLESAIAAFGFCWLRRVGPSSVKGHTTAAAEGEAFDSRGHLRRHYLQSQTLRFHQSTALCQALKQQISNQNRVIEG